MMVRVASGHFAGNVNLGGIAEVYDAFVPYIWGKGVFRIPSEPGVQMKIRTEGGACTSSGLDFHLNMRRTAASLGTRSVLRLYLAGVGRMILSSRQSAPARRTVTSAI